MTGDMNALRNGLSVATTATSLLSFGKFNPFFAHIGPLLGAIAKGWSVVEQGLRRENSDWWEFREEMLRCLVEPGGCGLLSYMRQIFAGSFPTPSSEIVDYFNDRTDMFNQVSTELMEESSMPDERHYLLWRRVRGDRLTGWVYANRQWLWRLIYGQRSTPGSGRLRQPLHRRSAAAVLGGEDAGHDREVGIYVQEKENP